MNDGLSPASVPDASRGDATLEALFRSWVGKRPEALALIDPPNRASLVAGMPRVLTYAEADQAVTALAVRLIDIGLAPGAIVAAQLPNTVEAALTLLATIRAGLVPAVLPLLWRRRELAAALESVGAQALVTFGAIGGEPHGAEASRTAADVPSVRFVCAFGRPGDGHVPLDDAFGAWGAKVEPPAEWPEAAAIGLVSWDTARPARPSRRTHAALLDAGLQVLGAAGIPSGACMLQAVLPGSFGALASAVVPWLLTGGTLSLHTPFDPDGIATQQARLGCDTLVLPASAADLAPRGDGVGRLIAVNNAPDRPVRWPAGDREITTTEVLCFGAAGILVRGPQGIAGLTKDGTPAYRRTGLGTLALPAPAMIGSAAHGERPSTLAPEGFVDTGYRCLLEETGDLAIEEAPHDLAAVGGFRFDMFALRTLIAGIDPDATIAAEADALLGARLVGRAPDAPAMRAQLAERGVNPLIVAAFAG